MHFCIPMLDYPLFQGKTGFLISQTNGIFPIAGVRESYIEKDARRSVRAARSLSEQSI